MFDLQGVRSIKGGRLISQEITLISILRAFNEHESYVLAAESPTH